MIKFSALFFTSVLVFCLGGIYSATCSGLDMPSEKPHKIITEEKSDETQAKQKELLIYPNPTKGKVIIVFAKAPASPPSFTVFNIIGKDLKNVEVTQISATHFEINLSDKDAGLYFIRIQSGELMITERITLDFTLNYTIS